MGRFSEPIRDVADEASLERGVCDEVELARVSASTLQPTIPSTYRRRRARFNPASCASVSPSEHDTVRGIALRRDAEGVRLLNCPEPLVAEPLHADQLDPGAGQAREPLLVRGPG